MRDPTFPATVPEALPPPSPTVGTAATTGRCGHSAAKVPRMPHRQAHVDAQWRAARAWLRLSYPRTDLDGVEAQLQARFPALAANVTRLEHVAHQESLHYAAEPAATPELFQVALREWENAMLDGLAALTHARPGEASPGHQLELREVPHG